MYITYTYCNCYLSNTMNARLSQSMHRKAENLKPDGNQAVFVEMSNLSLKYFLIPTLLME